MQIIEKDILTVENGIILHGCNAQIVMGSGVALALRTKYPDVFRKYKEMCQSVTHDFERLGMYCSVVVSPNLRIFNIISQLDYGNDGKRYSDYGAINEAFKKIAVDIHYLKNNQVYMPFNIFSDRGGADWEIVSKMIEFYFPNAIICKLPGGT